MVLVTAALDAGHDLAADTAALGISCVTHPIHLLFLLPYDVAFSGVSFYKCFDNVSHMMAPTMAMGRLSKRIYARC